MGKKVKGIVDISGSFSDKPDFPVAVVREGEPGQDIVDPVFDWHVTKNLFGRVMTLVEATTDMHKLSAVKDLFAKELRSWESDVYSSARELAESGDSSSNIYTRNSIK